MSTGMQAVSGLGLDAQHQRIVDYCAHALPAGVQLVDVIKEPGVSASRYPFLRRPSGRQLDAELQRGDHLVIAKLDRAFRNLVDCATMLDRWIARGVHVHILDIAVATTTPTGQLIVGIMASIAQWESRRIGDRIREAKAVIRARGRSCNGIAGWGFNLGPEGQLIADHRQRRIICQIVRLRDEHRLLFGQIAGALNRAGSRSRLGRSWTPSSAWHAYAVGLKQAWQQDVSIDRLLSLVPPPTVGYRRARGAIRREARMRVPEERRVAIARMGAAARWGKQGGISGVNAEPVLNDAPIGQ